MLFCPILTVLQSDVDLQKMRAWKRELAAQLVGWQWVFRWCANQVNSKNDAPFPFIILTQSQHTHRYFVGLTCCPKRDGCVGMGGRLPPITSFDQTIKQWHPLFRRNLLFSSQALANDRWWWCDDDESFSEIDCECAVFCGVALLTPPPHLHFQNCITPLAALKVNSGEFQWQFFNFRKISFFFIDR